MTADNAATPVLNNQQLTATTSLMRSLYEAHTQRPGSFDTWYRFNTDLVYQDGFRAGQSSAQLTNPYPLDTTTPHYMPAANTIRELYDKYVQQPGAFDVWFQHIRHYAWQLGHTEGEQSRISVVLF